MRLPLIAVLLLLGVPATTRAQEHGGDWSRILRDRPCHPSSPCRVRTGLVWNDSNPIPKYPPVMQDVGISGQVLVQLTVRPDGSVDPASVSLSEVTNRAFEQLTVEAARQWRFRAEGPNPPDTAITTTVRVVYAIPFTCGDQATPGGAAWAPDGKSLQLVIISGCRPLVPRDQVRPHNPQRN